MSDRSDTTGAAPAAESAEATRRLAEARRPSPDPCPDCGDCFRATKGGVTLCWGCGHVFSTVEIQPPTEPSILVVRR